MSITVPAILSSDIEPLIIESIWKNKTPTLNSESKVIPIINFYVFNDR